MTGPHTYRHIDEDSRLTLDISMKELVERIEGMNYGAHRFLSHLVDVRREKLARRIERYRRDGHPMMAKTEEVNGDRLADGIEELLLRGLT